MGALPLSKKADADAKDVKERLNELSGKITDAAEKVHTKSDVFLSPVSMHTRLTVDFKYLSVVYFQTAPGDTGEN